MTKKELHYRPARDFLVDALPCNVVDEVFRELEEEKNSKGPLDPDYLRRLEDWNYLGNQVVGAEVERPEYR